MSEIKEIARKILQLDNEISPQTKMSLADELAKKVLNEFGGVEVSAKGDCLNEKNVEDFLINTKRSLAMENKFKEFWIELEEKGARAFVYTEPVDGLNDDAIHTVEYAALEAANAEVTSLKQLIGYNSANLKLEQEKNINFFNKGLALEAENKKLTEQVTQLREALEHISSPKHWAIDTFVPEIRDRVKIARETLEKLNE